MVCIGSFGINQQTGKPRMNSIAGPIGKTPPAKKPTGTTPGENQIANR